MDSDAFQNHINRRPDPRNQYAGHPIITDQITKERLHVVYSNLEQVLKQEIPGGIVELGCYGGTTSLFIRRLMDEYGQSLVRDFHVYDSFEGLPEKTSQDQAAGGEDFTAGKLLVSKQDLIKQFKAARLQLPVIHKGWFNELTPDDLPETIALAFLDGDFYSSIIDSLRMVWPKMHEQGIILIDDYKNPKLPGVEQAIMDYFATKSVTITHDHDVAVIKLVPST
jgi:O-methyltransferase